MCHHFDSNNFLFTFNEIDIHCAASEFRRNAFLYISIVDSHWRQNEVLMSADHDTNINSQTQWRIVCISFQISIESFICNRSESVIQNCDETWFKIVSLRHVYAISAHQISKKEQNRRKKRIIYHLAIENVIIYGPIIIIWLFDDYICSHFRFLFHSIIYSIFCVRLVRFFVVHSTNETKYTVLMTKLKLLLT